MAEDVARFSGCTVKLALLSLAVISTHGVFAAERHMDCKVYEQQEQANVEAQRRVDPAIQDERFDMVFYSPARNSCLASVFFVRGESTYGGILDISEGRMIWAKSYRGTSFSPSRIVAMDTELDDEIKAIESTPDSSTTSRSLDFLPLLLDRTMNTLPAIKNAFTEAR
ncbi:MAG TPA: hypothetical protein VMB49_03360 [Acidobacteriaceae bacterium]|nr:hypothetical protein [Acidobacteriaceae bacterium]